MFHRFFLLIGFLLLSACAPLTIYHQTGVEVAKMETDLLACQVEGLDQAPVASQLRRGAPRYVPGYRHCSSSGQCYRRGGYYIPGEVYTVDTNAPLRRKLENQCMSQQGYRRDEIPDCPLGTTTAQAATATQKMPPLSEKSCAIRGNGGRWQIVEAKR